MAEAADRTDKAQKSWAEVIGRAAIAAGWTPMLIRVYRESFIGERARDAAVEAARETRLDDRLAIEVGNAVAQAVERVLRDAVAPDSASA